ncbi:MAG: class II SORL domain-containing protein [Methanobacteriota archaeon]|nr:MAG: class II SORL domain-containing protein [Euryarchaeota archaeon]
MSEESKTCEADPFCGIKSAKDPANATDFEKKHTPTIKAPDTVKPGEFFDVTIEVGKAVSHPNEPGHFIQWIELYSGPTFIARVDLTPALADTAVTIPVRLEHLHPLKAIARCNLHGAWLGEKNIKA